MSGMDEDLRMHSLVAFYFGTELAKELLDNSVELRSNGRTSRQILRTLRRRSYRDMNRTLRGAGSMNASARNRFEEFVDQQLTKLMEQLPAVSEADEFDRMHEEWCNAVMESFGDETCTSSAAPAPKMMYGHAQKWLNMFLKYAAVLDLPETRSAYQWFHVPIDRRVYAAMRRQNIKIGSSVAWSKLDANQYKCAQRSLREHCASIQDGHTNCPLDWEAQSWISPGE